MVVGVSWLLGRALRVVLARSSGVVFCVCLRWPGLVALVLEVVRCWVVAVLVVLVHFVRVFRRWWV